MTTYDDLHTQALTLKGDPRYDVGTMKMRGEPRIYFVVDRTAPQFTYPNSRYASPPFTTASAAERECLRLNQRVNNKTHL